MTQLEEMRSKLLAVADELVVPIEEAARAEGGGCRSRGARRRTPPEAAVKSTDETDEAEAPVDPRYEDLWVQRDDSIQIPDLASIDLDFDDREE